MRRRRTKIWMGLGVLGIIGGVVLFNALKAKDNVAEVPASAAAQADAQNAGQPIKHWTKRCIDDAPGSCEIFQRLLLKQNNMRLVEVAVRPLDNKQDIRVGIVLPLGITVASGVVIQVDDGTPHNMQIRTCNQGGCVAYLDLPADFASAMKRGTMLNVGLLDGKGQNIKIEMSLSGFAAQFAQL